MLSIKKIRYKIPFPSVIMFTMGNALIQTALYVIRYQSNNNVLQQSLIITANLCYLLSFLYSKNNEIAHNYNTLEKMKDDANISHQLETATILATGHALDNVTTTNTPVFKGEPDFNRFRDIHTL